MASPSVPTAAAHPGRHPYADFLDRVQKPARYVGGEYHQVRKSSDSVRARVCLAFPDLYDVGMSHLGTKILYAVLNRHPQIACERTFAPWVDMEAELRARGLPLLTLESAEPLVNFDVIGFSLQYELTYTNILNVLDLSGLPLRAADRDDEAPLILAGGPTATHPEPLAPFIDAFFIGEAEDRLPPLCLEAAELRRQGIPRQERLIRLAEKYPLYVPALYRTVVEDEVGFVVVDEPIDPRVPRRPQRVWVKDIDRHPFPDDSPLPYAEAIFDRMAVEIARGCTEGCRFCQAGMIYRPVRERDPVAVLDALVEGVRKGGYDETSLTSLSTADYSCVTPLVKNAMARLRDEKVSLSVSSLRAYGLNDELLSDMATMKAQGLTFAPEAGTQRMRDVICKNVTEDDINDSAHRIFGRGFQRMKLYFMIGLPTETDEDVQGIVETTGRVRDVGERYLKGAQVTASVSTHVPKPHTPFQWVAMDAEEDTARKQTLLADTARALRVSLKMHENHQSHLEGVFSRGDRRVGAWLEEAFRLGCRFDGWEDQLRLDLWEQALATVQAADSDFQLQRYLGTIPVTARLPWDHIDVTLEPGFLLKEYRKALKDRLSPPCGKPFKQLLHANNVADAEAGKDKKLVCYDCGVACDLGEMKEERLYFLRRMNAWTAPPPPPPAPRIVDQPLTRKEQAARSREAVIIVPEGSGYRYRIRYRKQGRVVYLGHLDLVRHLPRIFRRGVVEVQYGGGFRPRPTLVFGPALALGVPSLGEMLDVVLVQREDPAKLIARLNAVTLHGIDFVDAVALGSRDAGIGRVLRRAHYVARLPDRATLTQALQVAADDGPLSVVRRGGGETPGGTRRQGKGAGVGRAVDVRCCLFDVQALGANAEQAAALFGVDDGARPLLAFSVDLDPLGHARPREVIEALCGFAAVASTEIGRLGFSAAPAGTAGPLFDPLDVVPLRQPLTPCDTAPASDSDIRAV